MVSCKGSTEEISHKWSHHRISSTGSKVRTILHVFIIDSGSDRVHRFGTQVCYTGQGRVKKTKPKEVGGGKQSPASHLLRKETSDTD